MTETEAAAIAKDLTVEEIRQAAQRIAAYVTETPLLENEVLNDRVGGRVLLKAEVLQRTGSFKARGAFNKLLSLPPLQRARGVVAFSSGNHAQAVAYAARALGVPATIVMPADAPAIKIARTRGYGAEIVSYDREREDRAAIAERLAKERGAVVVPPFDDLLVIAGQGTSGLEIVRQARARAVTLDAVLAPASGGGLVAGIAVAVKSELPQSEVYAVEPAEFDDLARSLASRRREKNTRLSGSVCDALLVPSPGVLTFALTLPRLAGALAITDDEALAAVRFAHDELKLVVEPSGAIPLAAVLFGKIPVAGRTIALVLSGGNIDPSVLMTALQRS